MITLKTLIYLAIFIAHHNALNRICLDPIESGPCDLNLTKYGYNQQNKACEQFTYGGCGNSRNVFDTEGLCVRVCISNTLNQSGQNEGYAPRKPLWKDKLDPRIHDKPIPKVPGAKKYSLRCRQPVAVGRCKSFVDRWYFDSATDSCKSFRYSGCGGNSNRFENIFQCEQTCSRFIRDPDDILKSMCSQPKKLGECMNYQIRWYYDPGDERCKSFVYGGCNGNLNNFKSLPYCEKTCKPAPKLPKKKYHHNPRCIQEKKTGTGSQKLRRFYYDISLNNCIEFTFSGKNGNNNNFEMYFVCMLTCSTVTNQMTRLSVDDMIDTDDIGFF